MSSLGSVRIADAVGPAPEHQHVVAVYDRDEELVAEVVSFFSDALVSNGTAIVVATPEHRAALDSQLRSVGFDVDALRGSGRYRSFDARELLELFMVDHQPDPARFSASVGAMVADAESAGGPLFLFGEMVALLWDDGMVAAAIELESLWNDLAARHAFELFCAYASSSLTAAGDLAAAKRMCDRHSCVVALPALDDTGPPLTHDACVSYERLFVATPAELKRVREFMRATLRAWGDDDVDSEAEMITSELATNAVLHAHSPFRVSITRNADTLRVAVRDASFDPPEPRGTDAGTVGGRGMLLVAALSRSWGSDPEPDGKTVWAEVGWRRAS